ncbi:MAG: nucleotidyltransferase domain-containing protein [Bacteroidales bacterium]|nr:nucleotidyltransferase domain-containing protein [Bacteroidales bacterium]MCF8388694.1 nucleotidyltransferase domain-containing protein [Bacteroidales bacterium]MCF8397187.1 nucleotidyltransferase domain-containing protein [Bacteroidales bacterium]
MKVKTRNISQQIKSYVNSIDPNAQIILYGSRARGDERIDSDWDILILTDYQVDLERERKFRNKIYNLELETGEAFSVFVYSKSDWQQKQRISPFYHNVIQEGVRI